MTFCPLHTPVWVDRGGRGLSPGTVIDDCAKSHRTVRFERGPDRNVPLHALRCSAGHSAANGPGVPLRMARCECKTLHLDTTDAFFADRAGAEVDAPAHEPHDGRP